MKHMNYEDIDFILPPSFCAYKKLGHAKKIESSKKYKKDKGEKRFQNPTFEPWNPRLADSPLIP